MSDFKFGTPKYKVCVNMGTIAGWNILVGKGYIFFRCRENADCACALLNLGFEWSDPTDFDEHGDWSTTVQPLILTPAPKE